jgi:3-oxoadipate enol-lactonase
VNDAFYKVVKETGTMRVKVNGISIEYELQGEPGRPVVTLSHSLATCMQMWRPQVSALAEHFQVLLYDMRGHGESDAPAGPYSIETLAEDVEGLWDALGIQQSYFAGLSVGGKIGLMLARRCPKRVRGLILCNTAGRIPPEARAVWDERIAQVLAGGMESQREVTLRRWFTDGFRAANPDTMGWIGGLILATPPQGFIGCSRAIQDFDYMEGLWPIKTPVLLLPGEKDSGTPPADSEAIRERVPAARLTLVPNAAHLSNIEQPGFVTDAMLEFLLELEASAPALTSRFTTF